MLPVTNAHDCAMYAMSSFHSSGGASCMQRYMLCASTHDSELVGFGVGLGVGAGLVGLGVGGAGVGLGVGEVGHVLQTTGHFLFSSSVLAEFSFPLMTTLHLYPCQSAQFSPKLSVQLPSFSQGGLSATFPRWDRLVGVGGAGGDSQAKHVPPLNAFFSKPSVHPQLLSVEHDGRLGQMGGD